MGAAAVLQVDTPFTEDELFDITFEQQADLMVFWHLNHPMQRLTRYSHNDWRWVTAYIGTLTPTPQTVTAAATAAVTTAGSYHPRTIRYQVTAIDDTTAQESLPQVYYAECDNDLSLSGNYNTVDYSTSLIDNCSTYNIYKGETGGTMGFIGTGTREGHFRDDNISPDYSNAPPSNRNPFDGAGNAPGVGTFYEQRLIAARTLNAPSAFWGSQSAAFFNFNVSRPVQDDDSLSFNLLARRVNAIRHLVPMKSLIALTTDAIFSINGGADGFLSPTRLNITPEGYRGASKVRPVVIGDVIMYNTERGKQIRTLNYQFDRDGYRGNDITVFASHFFRRPGFKIVEMTWCEEPSQVMWAVRSDGKLLALTWLEEQDVWGWSLIETDGVVESCCTVGEGDEDRLYIVVRREIGGLQVRHVERLSSPNWDSLNDAIYMDAARSYHGVAATVISGLDYLEGRTVSILADGSAQIDQVVNNGRITLKKPAQNVTVGLPYESWIRTLPIAGQVASGGSTKGRPQVMGDKPNLSVRKTRGIEVALSKKLDPALEEPTQAQDEAMEFFTLKTRAGEPLSTVPNLYTGQLEFDPGLGDWDENTSALVVRQRYPLPMTILGIQPSLEVGG